MNIRTRLIAAVVVALIVGFGFMAYDKYTDAEWVVSPQTIEQARNDGQTGVETRPGTVAVRAIRSEVADLLPINGLPMALQQGFWCSFLPVSAKRSDTNSDKPHSAGVICRAVFQESGLLIG